MQDDEIIKDRIQLIIDGINIIEAYCSGILSKDDFLRNTETLKTLDAVIMRLQVIGENIKKIETLKPGFFSDIIDYDVTPVIRFRDFISHHYEKLDHEIIFEIITIEIPLLKNKLQSIE